MTSKIELRKSLRALRRDHAAAQPDAIRGLLFNTPPRPLLAKLSDRAIIGLYHAAADEAPTGGYARFFKERGHDLALPHFQARGANMTFRRYQDPHGESDIEPGPFNILQPADDRDEVVPDIVFVPLIGFTASGQRLGQGGGHYDRWLAEHPGRIAIGLAWDVQLIEPEETLPVEPHDIALDAIVTPTRMYGKL